MKTLLISLAVVFGIALAVEHDSNAKTDTTSISAYSQCKHSPETKFQAELYRAKYPSANLNQIKHIICKDQ